MAKATELPSLELPPTPDFDSYPIPARITEATLEEEGRILELAWSDGRSSRFHAVWLRDNASDEENLNLETREQWHDVTALPPDVRIAQASLDAVGALCLRWNGSDVESRFHPGWLYWHDYSNPREAAGSDLDPILWDAASLPEPPSFEGAKILEDDGLLKAWLEAVVIYGIARLRNVPPESGMVARVAERIGPVRDSNFGRIFDVKIKTGPGSNAYTTAALAPHTDLPTREYQPGLQFLHCLKASCQGGQAIMVDGFCLAKSLRESHPGAYDLLTRIPWPMSNRATDSDYRWSAPPICLNADGTIKELRVAPFLRAPLATAFDEVEGAYRALRLFFEKIADRSLQMRFDYRPGDLIAMDNRRLLHGRDAYEEGQGEGPGERRGERWLQGCYGEREELASRLRILARQERVAATTD